MSLIYSSTPQNITSTENTPAFSDWQPNQNSVNYYWSNALPVLLLPSAITIKVKDVIGNPDYSTYLAFRLTRVCAYAPGTTINWLLSTPPNLYEPIVANGTTHNFTPIFINLGLQSEGIKTFSMNYSIQGQLSDGSWNTISQYQYSINLIVSNTLVIYSPNVFNYNHVKNASLQSQDLNINGASWKVEVPIKLELLSSTPGITFGTNGIVNYATGSGEAVLSCKLTSYYDQVSLADGVYNENMNISVGTTAVANIPITITVESANFFIATPTLLNFTSVKGIEEPTNQSVFVECSTAPFTLEYSPWLIVTEVNSNQDGSIKEYSVVPIPTSNMESGLYEGFVKFKDTVSGNDLVINIPVTYDLQSFVSSPYPLNKKAFTLDPKYYAFSTTNENTYMQITSTIKTFDFFSDVFKETIIEEKLPLFQGKAVLHFGKTIHQIMNRFSSLNENLFQYKPAVFSMLVEERKVDTNELIRDAFIDNQEFVAGLSFDNENDFTFLDFNKKSIRVTKQSPYIINALLPDNLEYELRVSKNGISFQNINLGFPQGYILSKKITFEQFNPGDIIDVTINVVGSSEENVPKKTFYIIPEQNFSFLVFWENEFLLQSVLECTGNLSSKSDFEFTSNNFYKNLVEVIEHIETKKISKVTINTGWILSNQIDDVESLMRCKKAWLKLNEKTISIRPISKSKIDVDTDRDLVDYSIEFQINRNYDQETYSL